MFSQAKHQMISLIGQAKQRDNSESVADLDTDALAWWRARKLTYPLLTKLVRKHFRWFQPVSLQKGCLALLEM